MEGPRAPLSQELPDVFSFLTKSLRSGLDWSITAEYPTALTNANSHNMRIITDKDQIVSHAVLKPLIIKSPHLIFKVGAIGSVVTDPEYRNQGFSTQIIQECLTSAQQQQCDVAILWTDLFDFYRRMGFELAGYEYNFQINSSFEFPAPGVRFSADAKIAPDLIHKLYANHTINSVRTLDETKKYLSIPNTHVYTAWESDGKLSAYAIEGKGLDLNGYIHEWGGSVTRLMALFSFIRKRKQSDIHVIAPRHATNLISNLKHFTNNHSQGFLGMIKIVDFNQLSTKIKRAFRSEGVGDIVLEKQGDEYIFGCGPDLYTMNSELDMVRLLFGPVDIQQLDFIKQETRDRLAKVLPLHLWIWGWDSI